MKNKMYFLYLLGISLILAACGETIIYPEEKFTSKPSSEGGYIMSITKDNMLVVSSKPDDFSGTGGESEFYDAIYYHYPNAEELLDIGQRVRVEITGAVAESYPGQATAKAVEVLPAYKPKNAHSSEAKIIRKMLEQNKGDALVIIRSMTFQEEKSLWKVEVKQGEKAIELEIKDE